MVDKLPRVEEHLSVSDEICRPLHAQPLSREVRRVNVKTSPAGTLRPVQQSLPKKAADEFRYGTIVHHRAVTTLAYLLFTYLGLGSGAGAAVVAGSIVVGGSGGLYLTGDLGPSVGFCVGIGAGTVVGIGATGTLRMSAFRSIGLTLTDVSRLLLVTNLLSPLAAADSPLLVAAVVFWLFTRRTCFVPSARVTILTSVALPLAPAFWTSPAVPPVVPAPRVPVVTVRPSLLEISSAGWSNNGQSGPVELRRMARQLRPNGASISSEGLPENG